MEDKLKRKKKPVGEPVSFNIASISTIRFYENQIELGPKEQGKCQLGFGLNIDSKNGRLIFPMKVKFFSVSDNQNPFLGIETVHSFSVPNFSKLFKKDANGKFYIPDGLIERLLGLAISGTRGMLVASVTIPEYKKLFLPIVDISRLLAMMKNDPGFAKEISEAES